MGKKHLTTYGTLRGYSYAWWCISFTHQDGGMNPSFLFHKNAGCYTSPSAFISPNRCTIATLVEKHVSSYFHFVRCPVSSNDMIFGREETGLAQVFLRCPCESVRGIAPSRRRNGDMPYARGG